MSETDNFKSHEEIEIKTEDNLVNEKDVIYRKAAVEYFVTNVGWVDEDDNRVDDTDELRRIWTELFDGAPSAQPEIIRCKDCKHYKFSGNRAFEFPVTICDWTGFEDVDDDDYCSRAERRTDG